MRRQLLPRPVEITFPATGKVLKMTMHCVNGESGALGIVPRNFPRTISHMLAWPAGTASALATYDAERLGELHFDGRQVCAFPEAAKPGSDR
jgi:hypothetical protein